MTAGAATKTAQKALRMNMMLLYRVLAHGPALPSTLVGFGCVRGLVADQAADEARTLAAWTRVSQGHSKVKGG